MGLATSQVRLLALTSRKANLEMQMQLDSKRKTILMRESTTLSKLYYAKLQQARLKYSTGTGFADLTYGYVMGGYQSKTKETYYNGTTAALVRAAMETNVTKKGTALHNMPNTGIVDSYGRIVLDDTLFNAVIKAYNENDGAEKYAKLDSTYYSDYMTASALYHLLGSVSQSTAGVNEVLDEIKNGLIGDDEEQRAAYSKLFAGDITEFYTVVDYSESKGKYNCVCSFANVGDLVCYNGSYYYSKSNKFASNAGVENNGYCCETAEEAKNAAISNYITDRAHSDEFIQILKDTTHCTAEDIQAVINLASYFKPLLNAVFDKNSKTPTSDGYVKGISLSGTFQGTADNNFYLDSNKSVNESYKLLSNTSDFQNAIQSGAFTLVSLNPDDNYSGLDYYLSQGYFLEVTDSESRDKITAWYNAEKAELDEKETYWDSEINALSTELETINTEMESIKTLRNNAIDSTFKWGSA